MMNKALVLLVVAIIGIIGLTVYLNSSQKKQTEIPTTTAQNPQNSNNAPASSPVLVPFDYEVVSITSSEIVLTGKNGKLTLPNDSKMVSVYLGTPENNQVTSLTALKVGQKIKLEVTPGVSAKVFILE